MKSKKTIILILIILASMIPEVKAITPQSQTIHITDTHDDMFITEVGIGIDTSLVTIKDPEMDIRAFLVFRELEINYWEPLKNATLRLHTSNTLNFDYDNRITIYGMDLPDLQLEGWLLPSTVLSLGFTDEFVNYNTSEFYGNQWHEINVTNIVEELIRNPNWDGDGHAGVETGDAIGFHILGAGGEEKRYFYDSSVGNGFEAQLVIHWNHEPPPPTDPPGPDPEFVEQYGNYTIWSIPGGSGFEEYPGFQYRSEYIVEGSVWGAVTDYQVPIEIGYGARDYYTFADNGVSAPIMATIIAPKAIYYNGVTYIVWQGGDNTCDPYIRSYNHTTNTWSSTYKIGENPLTGDDHGAPALAIDSAGYLHVFYGSHSDTPGYLSHEKSDDAEEIDDWTAQANIVATEPTYPNPIVEGDNIWLFYRSSVSHDPDHAPERYRKWNGTDWEDEQTIIDNGVNFGIYMGNPVRDGVKIHMAWVELDVLDSDQRYNQFHAYFNTTDEHMYNVTGTDFGTLIDKTEADDYCMIVDSGAFETNHAPIKLDSSGYPHLVYPIEKAGGWEYNYIKWDGEEWTTPEGITTDTDDKFNFADAVVNSPTDIEAYLTTSGEAGRGGDIEKWVYDGESWTKESTVGSELVSGLPLAGPNIPVNHTADLKLVFGQGKWEDYGTHDLEAYAYGDDFLDTEFNLGGNCQSDFDDIRITDSDGITDLPYWREEYTANSEAFFWVKMPNIPESPDNATIYIYYGNMTVGTTSSHIDTMIRADNGTTGNFDEALAGTATLTHAGGKYKSTMDSNDDAFASGMILPDWNFFATIRLYGAFTDATDNQVQFGLYDVSSISDQIGIQAAGLANRRIIIIRDRSGGYPLGQLIRLAYFDAVPDMHGWNDPAGWNGLGSFIQAGDIELNIYSNGTWLFMDVLVDENTIIGGPASVAIASVKTFSSGVGLMWAEWLTDFYKVNQEIERYFVRKYVSPEPSLGDFGGEEGGDPSFFIVDGNGTVVEDDLDSLEDAEDWIDSHDPDPEDPAPPGWAETGPFTRFRTRLYIFLMGFGLLFGPLLYFAYSRPSGYEFVIGLFIMLVGYAFLRAAAGI